MVAFHRSHRRDANEPSIVAALRRAGAKVYRLSGEAGLPDLLVGFRCETYLMEVKVDGSERVKQNHRAGRSGLDPAQFDFHKGWLGGPCLVVTNKHEALEAIGWEGAV